MKIIGHRGAAGLALENSKEAFLLARKHKVDAIELDVRLTKDKQLVVIHDEDTGRLAERDARVRARTLAELKRIKLKDGQHLLSLQDVLKLRGRTPLLIELKDARSAAVLLPLLAKEARISVASFRHEEVRKITKERPDIPIYLLSRSKPLAIIQKADFYGAQGIGLNRWIINPVTYARARRRGLDIFVYKVNDKFAAWWLRVLYPYLGLCTGYPDRFQGAFWHTPKLPAWKPPKPDRPVTGKAAKKPTR